MRRAARVLARQHAYACCRWVAPLRRCLERSSLCKRPICACMQVLALLLCNALHRPPPPRLPRGWAHHGILLGLQLLLAVLIEVALHFCILDVPVVPWQAALQRRRGNHSTQTHVRRRTCACTAGPLRT